jgi:hypothetical protein
MDMIIPQTEAVATQLESAPKARHARFYGFLAEVALVGGGLLVDIAGDSRVGNALVKLACVFAASELAIRATKRFFDHYLPLADEKPVYDDADPNFVPTEAATFFGALTSLPEEY